MWWTPDGERILQGAEARLFREALGMVVDMVRDDHEGLWQFGAPPFDNLQPNQKLAVLAQVGTALLREDQPMPRLTAVLEAAVGAVYEAIRLMVEMEIDQPAEVARVADMARTGAGRLPGTGSRGTSRSRNPKISTNGRSWSVAWRTECFWDEDWRDDESLLDADPKASGAVKKLLGIDEDYYVAVPPDPTDEEMEGVWATLRGLTRGGS